MSELGATLAGNALSLGALMLATWLVSLWLRNASIVDIVWGPAYALVAAGTAARLGLDSLTSRAALVTALACLWGLRLGAYLFWRNHGKPEDFRYQAMRRYWGARFPLVSLATVFALQGALAWLISLPLQLAIGAAEPAALGPFDYLGAGLWLVGMTFEGVGDWQLARFRADPANRGRVLDTGLWRYTRHPNYFGDSLVWWGFFALVLSVPGGIWTVVSPVVMTTLLLRVSGVSLLERTLRKTKPGYADYVARTNAFIPGPPRG